MSQSGYIHVHVEKVLVETQKAFLLHLGDNYDDDFWIPKTQIADADDYSEGDQDLTMSITEWVANKLGIEENA